MLYEVITLPFLPGVTFDMGYRHETREGTEQAGAVHNSRCHGQSTVAQTGA